MYVFPKLKGAGFIKPIAAFNIHKDFVKKNIAYKGIVIVLDMTFQILIGIAQLHIELIHLVPRPVFRDVGELDSHPIAIHKIDGQQVTVLIQESAEVPFKYNRIEKVVFNQTDGWVVFFNAFKFLIPSGFFKFNTADGLVQGFDQLFLAQGF